MKKRILLFTLIAGMGYLGITSYQSGPASLSQNRTGAKASGTDCGGSGCHGGTSTAINTSIRVDSAGGVAVTKYKPGMTYTVTVTGSGGGSAFGFQYAAVSGTGAAQVQAGTFSALPVLVANHTTSGLNIIEHNTAIAGSLSKSFSWTAPAAGAGTVTMYLTVNAVDGNGAENPADVSKNISTQLQQYPTSAVANVANDLGLKAFPNPVSDVLHLQGLDAQGNYSVAVYDLSGKKVATGMDANGAINTASWTPGRYQVVVSKDGSSQAIPVVKQ